MRFKRSGKPIGRKERDAGLAKIAKRLRLSDPPQKATFLDAAVSFLTSLTKVLSFAAASLLIVCGICVLVARDLRPREMIVVQQMRLDDATARDLQLTEAILTDLITNHLNQIVSEGVAYTSSQLTSAESPGPQGQILALEAPVKVPVQNDLDLSFRGVSVAQIQSVYNYLRYKRTTLGGDFARQGNNITVLLTLNRDGLVKTWERPVSGADSGVSGLRSAVLALMSETYPELTGRMYLRDAVNDHSRLSDAGQVFARWINTNPLDERPYYYLITVYENLRSSCITGSTAECVVPRYGADPHPLITWVSELERMNDRCRPLLAAIGCAIQSSVFAWRARSTTDVRTLIRTVEANNLLSANTPSDSSKAAEEFKDIAKAYPSDVNVKLGLGAAQYGSGQKKAALDTLEAAEKISPENGKVQYDLGFEAWNTGSHSDAYVYERRALHFAPIFTPNSLIALGALRQYLLFSYTDRDYSKAADVCYSVLLMEPEALELPSQPLTSQSQLINEACATAFAAAGDVPRALLILKPLYPADTLAENSLRKAAGTGLLGQTVGKNLDNYDNIHQATNTISISRVSSPGLTTTVHVTRQVQREPLVSKEGEAGPGNPRKQ